jgi:hypothetical protein
MPGSRASSRAPSSSANTRQRSACAARSACGVRAKPTESRRRARAPVAGCCNSRSSMRSTFAPSGLLERGAM